MLLIAHQIENANAAIEMNFNSIPWRGNIANPPTTPKTAVSDVVHAGHPGVNAVSVPPKNADIPLLLILLLRWTLMLYATNAILIPASIATIPVKPTDAVIYNGNNSISLVTCDNAIPSVRK